MKRRDFTPEQIGFIRDSIQRMSTRECARAYAEHFGEPLGQTQLRRAMERNGINASGKRNDFVPIGTERYSDYYKCMVVKVDDYHVQKKDSSKAVSYKRDKNWKLKQNLVWEQMTGESLPKGWCVIFLDGDRMNYDCDNLYAVPLHIVGTIEKMRMHSTDPQIYKTALIWGQLYLILKKVNGREFSL